MLAPELLRKTRTTYSIKMFDWNLPKNHEKHHIVIQLYPLSSCTQALERSELERLHASSLRRSSVYHSSADPCASHCNAVLPGKGWYNELHQVQNYGRVARSQGGSTICAGFWRIRCDRMSNLKRSPWSCWFLLVLFLPSTGLLLWGRQSSS